MSGGYSDYWHGNSKISEKRILLTVEIESSQLLLRHSMSRVVKTGHCTKYLWFIWPETVQPVRNWELQAMTRLFRRVSNELFWVSAKYHNLVICTTTSWSLSLLYLQCCTETISSVDRGVSHFRRGLAFCLKHLFWKLFAFHVSILSTFGPCQMSLQPLYGALRPNETHRFNYL